MRFLRNASITIKVLISPAILVLAISGVALVSQLSMHNQRQTLKEIYDIALEKITLIDEFLLVSERLQSDVFRISVLQSMHAREAEIALAREDMDRGLSAVSVIFGRIASEWSLDENEASHVRRIKDPLETFIRRAGQAVSAASENPSFGVLLVHTAASSFAELSRVLADFQKYEHHKMALTETEALRKIDHTIGIIFLMVTGIVSTGLAVSILVGRIEIAKPVLSVTRLMNRLASGDLAVEIGDGERPDEIGGMMKAVEVFRQNAVDKAQAESALRDSETKLRNIVEHSTNLFYSHTPDHVLTYLSPQIKKLLGYEPEEAMVRWTELATNHPVNRRGYEITQTAIDTGQEQPPYELEVQHKDGHPVWVEVREAPVVIDGRITAIVGALIDITERKRAEEQRVIMEAQLRQSQKLESIGTLAGGVAHEINNPINGIMNYAQLIKDKLGSDHEVSEFAAEIGKETDRVATIVRNLLSFARVEEQSHSPARLGDIVESTLSLVRTIIRSDQIILDVHVPEELPKIKCRSQQIQQVLMNLLTNARYALNEKYPGYDENKRISISAYAFEREGKGWIRTTVGDTGPGIPEDVISRIFDPFFTTKGREKGTGLGLSISHGIVVEHKGLLWVESEVGEWTRFHMDLLVNNGWVFDE